MSSGPSTSPPPPIPPIPQIHLLCHQRGAAAHFLSALSTHELHSKINLTIHETSLSTLPADLTFDLVVSPANSSGILDGGFDDAISRAWSPPNDYGSVTRHVQQGLYQEYRGFLPPGTCYLTTLPTAGRGRLRYHDGKGWGCKYIALCPTMRTPGPCNWDREIVYECVWSLLCAIQRHNAKCETGEAIRSMLMTPMGTGAGDVSLEKWAAQAALAMKHFLEATENADVWRRLNWEEAWRVATEVETTHDL